MDNLPLISVIVPVYKVEEYLDKCVSSIVEQTYTNLEIILVDDGSPDNCPAMCDAWAENDSRIKVIHQENKGGGEARNAALDVANGELIAFVDSDDYIAPDMYDYLYGLLNQGADIAECGYIEVTGDDAVLSQGDEVRAYSAQEAMAAHIRDCFFRQLIWNKLYRREAVENVRFPAENKIDDEFFTYQVIGNAKLLIKSNKICYAYRQQPSSVMHILNSKQRLRAVDAKAKRHTYILEKFPDLSSDSLKSLWFTCIYQGQLAQKELGRKEAGQIMRYLKSVLSAYPCMIHGCTTKEKIWLSLATVSLKCTCKIRNILGKGM